MLTLDSSVVIVVLKNIPEDRCLRSRDKQNVKKLVKLV